MSYYWSTRIATKSYYYTKTINYVSKILFIGNLNSYITDAVLRTHFKTFGYIINIEINEKRTFAFLEYIYQSCASNAINTMNGQILKGNRLHLDFGIVIAPRCLILNGIPDFVDENGLIKAINNHFSNSELDIVRMCMFEEKNGSALIFFNCDIYKAYNTLSKFLIRGSKLEIDFASHFCMFSFGDSLEFTCFKNNRQPNNNHYGTNEQCSSKHVDHVSSNSTYNPEIHELESAKHKNDNSVIKNIRSPKTPFKSSNLEIAVSTNTNYPRIRVIPLDQLMGGINDTANHTSHASTNNCSQSLVQEGTKTLDLSSNLSVDQSTSNESVELVENEVSNIEQTNEQELSDECLETQIVTVTSEQLNQSSADNINHDETENFVPETESLETTETCEQKVIIDKHINNSKNLKKGKTNKRKRKPKCKVEVDINHDETENFVPETESFETTETCEQIVIIDKHINNSKNLKKGKTNKRKRKPKCKVEVDINHDETENFVPETESFETTETYEQKVIINKYINNSTSINKGETNKRKKKPECKVEVDEIFIKYESMYDKVKARSNRNSQLITKIKVEVKEEKPNFYYSLRSRK